MSTWGVIPPDGSGDEPHDLEGSMDLSELFEALRAPGTDDELARADDTVAAMVAAHAEGSPVVVPMREVDRRPALIAVGSAVGVLSLVLVTGTAAAAYSGALPANLQRIAHQVIGAPAPAPVAPGSDDAEGRTSSQGGQSEFTETPPNGNGPATTPGSAALFGLCTAYADKGTDDLNGESVAFKVLSEAASAQDQTIEEFCAPILATKGGKPSTPPGQSNKPSTPPGQSNKPSTPPGQSNKPSTPPGQTNKPSAPPGQTNKPSTPPGQTKTPPGQTRKPTVTPGQTARPTPSNNKPSTPPGQTRKPTSTPS